MQAGARLHHNHETRRWWLLDGAKVNAEAAWLVIKKPKVIADADTWIAGALTQTYKHKDP